MENLNRRIKLEMSNYSKKKNEDKKHLNVQKMQLYTDFQIWLDNLKNSMRLCKYRQVIGEIEARKNNFKSLEELHWKYQYIEIDAIFKIIKKKILSHSKDIGNEGSHQYHSCLFWFNQIFLLLEQLILEIRPDLNPKLDYKNTEIMKPIQCVIDGFIKFCFLLVVFSQYNQDIPDILSYLSIIERIIPYMSFTGKSSSHIYLQKILLFKVKILAENCDYMNAVDCVESNIDLCFEYIRLLSDEDFNVYISDITNEKNRKYLDHLYKRRLFQNRQYRELKEQNENISISDAETKLKNNLKALNEQRLKEFTKFDDIINDSPNKSTKRKKKTTGLDDKKISSSISNVTNITNTSNKEIKNYKKINKQIKPYQSANIQNKKIAKIKQSNKSVNKTSAEDSKKKNLYIKKKTLRNMEKRKKRIIEEVLSNISLNFYLRGAIFEHVGNIDSALDSYKEVEWFCMKFLSSKFPYFVKYMSSLLNCAWNNYNIIIKLKYEKEKVRRKNVILKNIEIVKRREKIAAQERHNQEMLPFKSSKLNNNKKLNDLLKELGNKIYKEEEQRNFNIYNKFTKTGYILSTYKMIDDLLSDDLRQILRRMKKVSVTKQGEEIKDLIDKALIKKQHQSYIKEDNSAKNNINNNIIHNNFNNTKTSSITKESRNINNISNTQNKNLQSFNKMKYKLVSLKKANKRNNAKTIFHIKEQSGRVYSSTSCEVSFRKIRKVNPTHPYYEKNLRYSKNTNKTKLESSNMSQKYFSIKNNNLSEIPKIHSAISFLRSSISKEKRVEKYEVDKNNFSKNLLKKKTFLDKYSKKEFNFLRDLLETKSVFPEVVKPIDDLELKKVRQDADLNFNTKLEIAKSGRGKKNLTNLIKQNINLVTNKNNKNNYITNRSETQTESENNNNNNNMDNNEKLKKLDNEYYNIILKTNRLFKRKKGINSAY